jgi:hypothetical protein
VPHGPGARGILSGMERHDRSLEAAGITHTLVNECNRDFSPTISDGSALNVAHCNSQGLRPSRPVFS